MTHPHSLLWAVLLLVLVTFSLGLRQEIHSGESLRVRALQPAAKLTAHPPSEEPVLLQSASTIHRTNFAQSPSQPSSSSPQCSCQNSAPTSSCCYCQHCPFAESVCCDDRSHCCPAQTSCTTTPDGAFACRPNFLSALDAPSNNLFNRNVFGGMPPLTPTNTDNSRDHQAAQAVQNLVVYGCPQPPCQSNQPAPVSATSPLTVPSLPSYNAVTQMPQFAQVPAPAVPTPTMPMKRPTIEINARPIIILNATIYVNNEGDNDVEAAFPQVPVASENEDQEQ